MPAEIAHLIRQINLIDQHLNKVVRQNIGVHVIKFLFDAQRSLFHVSFEKSLSLSHGFWVVVVHSIHSMQSIGNRDALRSFDRHVTPNTSKLRTDLETWPDYNQSSDFKSTLNANYLLLVNGSLLLWVF
jgi:hypothetical protein